MKTAWKLVGLLMPVVGLWGCGAEEGAVEAKAAKQQTSVESTQQAVLGSYEGCRGNAFAVCAENVDPSYYYNHSSCERNPVCDGEYYSCDEACPAPTASETPNVHVVAAGRVSPTAGLLIGYVWSAGGTGGFVSNSVYGSSIDIADNYRWSALTHGVGVNATGQTDARVRCYTYDVESSATSNVSVTWTSGSTATYDCDGDNHKDCWVTVPVNDGFTATCNLVLDVPSYWVCNSGWYGTNDGCDCGCYADDPDCNAGGTEVPQIPGEWPSSCDYCWDSNQNRVSCE